MDIKLTLKLDEEVIRNAKKAARNEERSLSRMVEDYFRSLNVVREPSTPYTALVRELSGIIDEENVRDVDYTAYLEKKYE